MTPIAEALSQDEIAAEKERLSIPSFICTKCGWMGSDLAKHKGVVLAGQFSYEPCGYAAQDLNVRDKRYLATIERLQREVEEARTERFRLAAALAETTTTLESKLSEMQKRLEEMVAAVPTSWLDPLLSGPHSVIPDMAKVDCATVEVLLRAVKERLVALLTTPTETERDR
jgi:hypothetical protein